MERKLLNMSNFVEDTKIEAEAGAEMFRSERPDIDPLDGTQSSADSEKAEDVPRNEDKKVEEKQDEQPKRRSQADLLTYLSTESAMFFKTPQTEAYACINIKGHMEVWPIRSMFFRHWMSYIYYKETGKAHNAQALQDALRNLTAKAFFGGEKSEVHLRVAGARGNVYIDLANGAWEQIEITNNGWQVISSIDSPIKFRRSKGIMPLPRPRQGDSLELMRDFFNIENENEWVLLVSWLLGSLRPGGPYPILILQGEQGTAKSTTAKLLRSLIDPSTVPVRTLPRNERDLAISANSSWIMNFDNLSGLKPWLSDAFCRLATGGGFSTRTLFTDDSEELFNSIRPLIMNGISDLATRHDLADRSLIINLPPIPDDQRKSEKEIWNVWEGIRPSILGAVCDGISMALRQVDDVSLSELPRMADFAKWIVAAEPALPWENGTFLKAYMNNRSRIIDIALESDPVATTLVKMIDLHKGHSWSGKASDLLMVLTSVAGPLRESKTWPRAANILSNRIRRSAPFLRKKGLTIEWTKSGERIITIRRKAAIEDDKPLVDQDAPLEDGDFEEGIL